MTHDDVVFTIPQAPFDDLDLRTEADDQIWERRLQRLAENRMALARARLEAMGVINSDGALVSKVLPRDMDPASPTGIDTR